MSREDGQTAAEYMGILLVVAAIVALIVPGLPSQISGRVGHLVSCIGAGGCTATAAGGSDGGPPVFGPNQPTGPLAAAAAWGGQAANLPQGGDRPYVPPKSSHGQPKKVPAGGRGGAKGYEDADGNIWVWNPPGSSGAHGGAHWDVQHPDGSHTNVYPDGSIRGEDNFPNKSRGSDDSGSSDSKDNTSKIVGGAAAGVGAGAIIWWGAKRLSPACGPFAPVCAIGL